MRHLYLLRLFPLRLTRPIVPRPDDIPGHLQKAPGMDDPAQANPFRKLQFGTNQDIFTEGQSGDVMYFVERGEVRIWTGRAPNDRTLSTIGRGGFFGEMALVDGKPRSANATACGLVEVRAIPGSTLRSKLHNADPFVKALVRILVENLRSATGGRQ